MAFYSNTPKRIKLPISLIGAGEVPDVFTEQLKRRGYSLSEESLLRCINDNKATTLVYYTVIALKTMGTGKSIAILKKMTSYPKADIKVCAVLAIGTIAGERETEYYAELLDSNFRDKWYVMAVVWEVGNERAYDAVRRLAKKVRSRKIAMHHQSEMLYITEYMGRYATSVEDLEIISQLLGMSDNLQQL